MNRNVSLVVFARVMRGESRTGGNEPVSQLRRSLLGSFAGHADSAN